MINRFVLFTFLLILTSCGSGAAPDVSDENISSSTTNHENAAPSFYPVEVTDAYGEPILIEEDPSRIVSLMPSNTEILYALGKGDAVVGVTDFDHYPPEVEEVDQIGSGLQFDIEKVLGLEPNVVFSHISSGNAAAEGIRQLEDAGITVVTVPDTPDFPTVFDTIMLIGTVTNKEEKAQGIVEDIENEIMHIREENEALSEEEVKSVWVEVSSDPELYTAGSGTFLDEMLTVVGAENAAGKSEGWVSYSEEEAVALNPDVIISTYGEEAVGTILERDAWQEVSAVQEGNVYALDEDILSRPGPRLIEGLRLLAEHIYPDVYVDE